MNVIDPGGSIDRDCPAGMDAPTRHVYPDTRADAFTNAASGEVPGRALVHHPSVLNSDADQLRGDFVVHLRVTLGRRRGTCGFDGGDCRHGPGAPPPCRCLTLPAVPEHVFELLQGNVIGIDDTPFPVSAFKTGISSLST
ncbi:hypothetical protein [Mycobacterium syngnathidarum]|uniref:hypothetical protein n=1 Tax=Mycobacterium syngnathidarum TaxID=1908205 RepID=UPI0013F5A659|nr:hypothetical protein [Mycobacterium syngnathidarum]